MSLTAHGGFGQILPPAGGGRFSTATGPRRGLNCGARRGRRNRVGRFSWPPAVRSPCPPPGSFVAVFGQFVVSAVTYASAPESPTSVYGTGVSKDQNAFPQTARKGTVPRLCANDAPQNTRLLALELVSRAPRRRPLRGATPRAAGQSGSLPRKLGLLILHVGYAASCHPCQSQPGSGVWFQRP